MEFGRDAGYRVDSLTKNVLTRLYISRIILGVDLNLFVSSSCKQQNFLPRLRR